MRPKRDQLFYGSRYLVFRTLNSYFYLFQRNLDQLETLSKKLKAKTLRTETPQQSIAATRYLNDYCLKRYFIAQIHFTLC